jgi:eukaryotic-like serine/threonine-protein kinase
VNVANGRIARRIPFDGGPIAALAASQNSPKKIRAGDAVAADPNGQFLLVESVESPNIRLLRVPLNGGPEQEIPGMGAFSPANIIIGGAVDRQGRILTPLGALTFFWPPGMVDSRTGRWSRIPVDAALDYHQMAWTPDGKILALALDQQATLWKFHAAPDR